MAFVTQLTSTVDDDDFSPHMQTQAVKDSMFEKAAPDDMYRCRENL